MNKLKVKKKKKKLKLALVGFILLFTGYILYKNVTFGLAYTYDREIANQRYIKKMPGNLSFAEEVVEFKSKDAYKNYYRELKLRTKNSPATRQAIKNAGYWFPVIEEILRQYKLPEDLKYLALAESNLTNSKSKKGAVGFWQFTKKSGIHVGLVINDEIDERLDPVKSTHAACKYLKHLYNYFGSWSAAIAGYNLGETALYFAFRKQKVNSYYDLKLNKETSSYIYRMVALKDLFENAKKYKIKYKKFKVAPTKIVVVRQDIKSVPEFAKNNKTSYKLVKALNPWMLKDQIHIPEGRKALYVKVPRDTKKTGV